MRQGLIGLAAAAALIAAGSPAVAGKMGACWIIGDHPAAATREQLAEAAALMARDDKDGLRALRATGEVLVPHPGKVQAADCDGDLCRVTVFGRTWWMERRALQCK